MYSLRIDSKKNQNEICKNIFNKNFKNENNFLKFKKLKKAIFKKKLNSDKISQYKLLKKRSFSANFKNIDSCDEIPYQPKINFMNNEKICLQKLKKSKSISF